jgi:hypothetical protein
MVISLPQASEPSLQLKLATWPLRPARRSCRPFLEY